MKKTLRTALIGLSTIGIAVASFPVAAATSDTPPPSVVSAGWFNDVTSNLKNLFTPSRDGSPMREDESTPDSMIGRKRGGMGDANANENAQKRRGRRPGGPIGTITAITGNTITMTTPKGHTLTISVTPETTFMKAVQNPTKKLEQQTIADLAVGEVIGIKPTIRPAGGERPTRGERPPAERPTELTAIRVVELPGLPPMNTAAN